MSGAFHEPNHLADGRLLLEHDLVAVFVLDGADRQVGLLDQQLIHDPDWLVEREVLVADLEVQDSNRRGVDRAVDTNHVVHDVLVALALRQPELLGLASDELLGCGPEARGTRDLSRGVHQQFRGGLDLQLLGDDAADSAVAGEELLQTGGDDRFHVFLSKNDVSGQLERRASVEVYSYIIF